MDRYGAAMAQPVEHQDDNHVDDVTAVSAPSRRPWGGYVLLGLLLAAAAVLVASFVGQGGAPLPADSATSAGAESVCTDRFVPAKLKAPRTANFVGVTAREDASAPGTFVVDGAVDSQNSFGALVRSRFECRVSYAGNGSWKLVAASVS